MNNLLAGTGIGTVFVDHQLRILRFTPAATRIINLITSDVGRPVGHIVSNLIGYDHLIADLQAVLDTLLPKEVEVRTREDRWYTMRIQLYRTLDNVIEGAVITFVDISEMKAAEARLQESESYFSQLAASLPELVWTCRPDGIFDYLSPQWVAFTGAAEPRQMGIKWLDQVHPEDRNALVDAWNAAVAKGEPFRIELRLRDRDGAFHWFETRASALRDAAGSIVKWIGLNTEITAHRSQDPQPSGGTANHQERIVMPHEKP
jgi:two-component system CheB/CheR fusion protein